MLCPLLTPELARYLPEELVMKILIHSEYFYFFLFFTFGSSLLVNSSFFQIWLLNNLFCCLPSNLKSHCENWTMWTTQRTEWNWKFKTCSARFYKFKLLSILAIVDVTSQGSRMSCFCSFFAQLRVYLIAIDVFELYIIPSEALKLVHAPEWGFWEIWEFYSLSELSKAFHLQALSADEC